MKFKGHEDHVAHWKNNLDNYKICNFLYFNCKLVLEPLFARQTTFIVLDKEEILWG